MMIDDDDELGIYELVDMLRNCIHWLWLLLKFEAADERSAYLVEVGLFAGTQPYYCADL